MHYNNLMFSTIVHIDKWSLYVLRTMLSSGFVPCTIDSMTTCMFMLNNALKGFDDSQQSKFKPAAKWIVVKVNDLNNFFCLKN